MRVITKETVDEKEKGQMNHAAIGQERGTHSIESKYTRKQEYSSPLSRRQTSPVKLRRPASQPSEPSRNPATEYEFPHPWTQTDEAKNSKFQPLASLIRSPVRPTKIAHSSSCRASRTATGACRHCKKKGAVSTISLSPLLALSHANLQRGHLLLEALALDVAQLLRARAHNVIGRGDISRRLSMVFS